MDVKRPIRFQVFSTRRQGMTIVEVLVCIGILALLSALLMPAIQMARESARRTACQNHAKQFGVALAAIEERTGAFPTGIYRPRDSGYLRLLPYFDAGAIRDQLLANQIPEKFSVPAMICPDDEIAAINMETGEASYFFNKGTRFFKIRNPNGFFSSERIDTKARDISDGLSQTVAMSERLVTPVVNLRNLSLSELERETGRYFWWTKTRYKEPGEEDLAAEECRTHRVTPFPQHSGFGAPSYLGAGCYSHLLPPNATGCYDGPEDFEVGSGISLAPASSNHPGGATSLFADGSVHFISEKIDLSVWRALGTRNGAEQIAGTQF